jgi:uncharacterized membrane protein
MAPPPAAGGEFAPASDTSKLVGAIGYLIWIVALVMILIEPYKNEKFVRLHAIQALGLWITWFVGYIVVIILGIILAFIPYVGSIVGLLLSLVLWVGVAVLGIMGIINAAQGKYWEMPIIHGFVKNYI